MTVLAQSAKKTDKKVGVGGFCDMIRGFIMADPTSKENWEWFPGEAVSLWKQVWMALNRALALCVVVAIHKLLDVLTAWVIPPDWQKATTLTQAVFFAAFLVVYAHFAWEFAVTFAQGPVSKIGVWLRGDKDAKDENPI
jgi:hypothetical protein